MNNSTTKITYGSKNQEIKCYKPDPRDTSDWTSHYPKSDAEHSSWLLGNFLFNHNGLMQIQDIVEKALSTEVIFENCTIEKSVRFDQFPRPSMRDMVIEGETREGKSLFITIEAKAS